MAQKSSVSALEVRKAIDSKLFTEHKPTKIVRAGEKNFATTSDFSRSPLELCIAIEERNLAVSRRFELAEIAGTYSTDAVLASMQDTSREDEIHKRKTASEESAKWNRLAMFQHAQHEEHNDNCPCSECSAVRLKQDVNEWNSLDMLPLHEIRRKVVVKRFPSALELGLINNVIPANTLYVTCEAEPQAEQQAEPQAEVPRKRKQTARKAYLRKLRFIASRELHHIQSIKRIDGVLTVRYWLPVWTVPKRTKRKAGRARFNPPVCTQYVVHCVTLRDYLSLYDDCGLASPTIRQRYTLETMRRVKPEERQPMQCKQGCDFDRRVKRIPELFAGESSGEKIHNRGNWWGQEEC